MELAATLVVQVNLASESVISDTEILLIAGAAAAATTDVPREPVQETGEAPPASSETWTVQAVETVGSSPVPATREMDKDPEAERELQVKVMYSSLVLVPVQPEGLEKVSICQ